jgi:lysophospholipase L1-like esterase
MNGFLVLRRAAMGAAIAAALVVATLPVRAQLAGQGSVPTAAPPSAVPACAIPGELARFDLPLRRTARGLAAGRPIKVVAIGSSSTAGAGASSPGNTYPSRLAADLKREFVDRDIAVLNRGISGDLAEGMVARFEADVIAENPDLVLWQVGTNSLLSNHPLKPHHTLLRKGVRLLKAAGADVVLIDPQYAPRVIAKSDAEGMVAQITETARFESVDVFQRFALMRHWRTVQGLPFSTFLSPDELHMNDYSYACIARALSQAIAEAATRPVASASMPVRKR